jgi:hypothetical protein
VDCYPAQLRVACKTVYSPKFVEEEFSEVPDIRFFSEVPRREILGSSHPEIATWHTKIVHLGDAPHQATLIPYLCYLTWGRGPKPFALRPDD